MARILIVDDDPGILRLFERLLRQGSHDILTATSGGEAIDLFLTEPLDLVIADLALPDIDGVEILRRVRESAPALPFIIVTGFATVESAVEAMKLGAFDYITKPLNVDEFGIIVEKALEHRRLHEELKRLRTQVDDRYSFDNIVGKSKVMQSVFELVRRVADSEATVLISGESGTGKELIARAIHRHSPRRPGPFVAINCAGLPETLLESELFGHMKGAFTGAHRTKRGLFTVAEGGTLLLDEIGEMSVSMQAKLLRALQEKEVKPVGATESTPVDVRVVSSTNRDLKEEMGKGRFREDLYYRLAVVPIEIPPLRERPEDIPVLVGRFLEVYAEKNDITRKSITPRALAALTAHSWQGNVRELENVVERALLISDGDRVDLEDLPSEIRQTEQAAKADPGTRGMALAETVESAVRDIETGAIVEALAECGGNRSAAARKLGISRANLYQKMRKYQLD